MSSVSSAIPPIPFEEVSAALAEAFGPRVKRLGYLGEFFQRAAHQPDALLAFNTFTEVGKNALGERLTEVVALTASVKMGNTYERNQHERLSIRRGLGREWVSAVEKLDPSAAGPLDDQDREAQRVVLAVVENYGHFSLDVVENYGARYGAPAAVALLLVVGRYMAHGAVVNALEIGPPVPSIFDDGFDGD